MIWFFSDIYWPTVSGVPVTIDYLVSTFVTAGYPVSMVTVGTRSIVSERTVIHITPPTRDSVAFEGDQVAFFSAYRLARMIPSSPDDLFIIATPGRIGMTGLGIARRRKRPAIMLYLTDALRYARYYPAARPILYALPKACYLFSGAITRPVWQSGHGDRPGHERIAASHYAERFPWPLTSAVRLVYGRASTIVALSEKSVLDLTDAVGLPRDRISRIASGFLVPTQWHQVTTAPPSDARSREGLRLLYVGRIAPEKCLEDLLAAIAWNRSCGVPVTLTMAGAGHGEVALREAIAALRLRDAVTLQGVVRREDLGSLYTDADLFAFPSTTDTQGLAILEAAWFGVPALLLDRDIPKLAGAGAAFVADDGVRGSLAAQIAYLWRHPEVIDRAAMGLRARVDQLLSEVTAEWLDLVARVQQPKQNLQRRAHAPADDADSHDLIE